MLLLAEGADPFLMDRRQLRTALHYAAAFGQAAVLRALLSEGTIVDTAAGRVALRNAKVCDMSGVCTWVLTVLPFFAWQGRGFMPVASSNVAALHQSKAMT